MLSPLKTVKKPLAGGELTVTQFAALRAIRVGTRVAKLAAPVLAGMGKGLNLDDLLNGQVGEKLAGLDIDLNSAVPNALNALAMTLDPNDFASLIQELLSGAVLDRDGSTLDLSQPGAIDAAVGGSLPDLFTAVRSAFEANDFFGLGAIGKLRGMLKAPTLKSPAASTPV